MCVKTRAKQKRMNRPEHPEMQQCSLVPACCLLVGHFQFQKGPNGLPNRPELSGPKRQARQAQVMKMSCLTRKMAVTQRWHRGRMHAARMQKVSLAGGDEKLERRLPVRTRKPARRAVSIDANRNGWTEGDEESTAASWARLAWQRWNSDAASVELPMSMYDSASSARAYKWCIRAFVRARVYVCA
jgi:hypothetical protein